MNAVILCIEENPDTMAQVRQVIERMGHRFIGVQNGCDGLKRARERYPDIILLDISLPDIDGYSVSRQLRESDDKRLAYVPVVAIIGNAYRGDAEKAIEAGCDVYISRPLNLRELQARVEGLLEVIRH